MASKPSYHPQTKFRIEPPYGTVTVFRIRYREPGGKWTTVKDPEIALANRLQREGVADAGHTKEKLKVILRGLYALRDSTKKRPAFMAGNLAILERMWAEKYTARRKRHMKRPQKSYDDLTRAIEAAGMHPLDTCDQDDLADYLDETLGSKPRRHARRITWINSILKYLGRETIPVLEITGRRKVRYLNEAEFSVVLLHLPDDHCRVLAQIAFYTGLRLGEIFYILPSNIRPDHLVVEEQMTDIKADGGYKTDSTKTRAVRDAFLPKQAKDIVAAWAKVPLAAREKHRHESYAPIIQRACRKAFPGDVNKHLTFHALRHCNAIWLLQKGASIHEVAQHLGNHIAVTERYYSGFELKKESIERLKSLVN